MTNYERLLELLKVDGYDDCGLTGCDGIKCPEEFKGHACHGCPYEHFWQDEYTGWDGEDPTTKNNLGVNWENYKDVDGNSLDDLILEVLQNNFDCGNTYGYKVADEIISLLPSVTPQEPKIGHWVNKQHLFDYCSAECSSCHKRSNGYVHDNGFSLEHKYYDFCPNCGSDNREAVEDGKV